MNLEQRTKDYTLKQLIKILYLRDDYSNEAVAAAEQELDKRDVSQEEVDEILKEVEFKDERNSAPNTLQKAENVIAEAIAVFFKLIDPFVKKEVPDLLKGIAIFLILIPLILLIIALKDFSLFLIDLKFVIIYYVQIFGPLLVPFLGGVFLWNLKDYGWYLSVFSLVYIVVAVGLPIVLALINFCFSPNRYFFFLMILWALLCITVYSLYEKRVLEFLSIKKNAAWIVSILSILCGGYAGMRIIEPASCF